MCLFKALLAGLLLHSVSANVDSAAGFFRIEAELLEFKNINGTQANGKNCDQVTTCDPVFYYYIDTEQPQAEWPGAAKKAEDFEMITWKRNSNDYLINTTIKKDICGGGLARINIRVEVLDEDFFSKYDLIERFECKIRPDLRGIRFSDEEEWTEISTEFCQPKEQPRFKVSLAMRWRVYRVRFDECGKRDNRTPPLLASNRNLETTTRPPLAPGEP